MPAILFDMDDTLYNLMMPFEAACRKMLGNRFDSLMEPLFLAHRMHSDEVFEASRNGEITMDEMYIYRIQKAMEDFGFSISGEEALNFQRIYAEEQKRIWMSDTVREMLEFIKSRGIPMGMITNGPEEHQWRKIVTLGADCYVPREYAIISGAAGAAKPDFRIFEYAEEAMELRKEDTWFVGDSYENDIVGAVRAGWHAVWFNRRERHIPEEGPKPDYTVESEQELFVIIKQICATQSCLRPLL